MKLQLFVWLFIIVAISASAQVETIPIPKSNKRVYKKAMVAYREHDYFLAKHFFDALVAREALNDNQRMDYVKLLFKLGEYEQAKNQMNLISPKGFSDPIFYYYKALAYHQDGDYKNAKDYILFFLKDRTTRQAYPEENKHVGKLKQFIDSNETQPIAKYANVYPLQGEVNQSGADFNPVITKNGIYYGSQDLTKINYYSKKTLKKSKIPATRQIKLAIGQKDTFTSIEAFPLEIEGMELSSFCFDLSGRVLYLTGCVYNEDSLKYNCQIYQSKIKDKTWSTPEIVPELYAAGSNSTHVSMGYDPMRKSPVLFFSSDRKGTRGGYDIWMSSYNTRSLKFYTPRNLGHFLNSSKDDITPYYHTPTNRLYYSSNGLGGLGGHDIYYTNWNQGIFSPLETLGTEVNSPQDDVFFTPNLTLTRGYLVSNRYSENSLINPHCCDDIFYFDKLERQSDTPPSITIGAMDNHSKEGITQYAYRITKIDSNQNSYLIDQNIGTNNTKINDLEKSIDYEVEIYAKGYYRKKEYIRIPKDSTVIFTTIQLEKINYNPIILPLVEFEFDSFTLTSKARKIIDSLLVPVLISNPTLKIELSAHTDSRGTTEYNELLSSKRAHAILFYLTDAKNIQPERLEYKGYGEYVPVAPNENPDGTDNEEGRQRNRRCEFRILPEEFDPY